MGNTSSSLKLNVESIEHIVSSLLQQEESSVDSTCISGVSVRKQKEVIERAVGHAVVGDQELRQFLSMITNKMVLFPVIGEGSSGKSTLINALLGDEYLPFSCSRETATRIYIMNAYQDCPSLYKSLDQEEKNLVARGVADINKAIKRFNEDSKNNFEVPEILLICTKIPLFGSDLIRSSLIPILVDCPGIEYMMKDMSSYLSVVSGVIYVHNYRRFLQNPMKIKEDMQMPKNAKPLFVTSHFDAYYAPRTGDNPGIEEVKQRVAEAFPALVEEDDVFPVCGQWALCSRMNNVEEAQLVLEQARSTLRFRKLSDANEKIEEEVLKFSNIKQLEQRLKELIEAVDQTVWFHQVIKTCDAFLQKLIESGEKCKQDLACEKKDQDDHISHAQGMIEAINEMTWKNSSVLNKEFVNHLADKCFLERIKAELMETTNTFFSTVNKEMSVEAFQKVAKEFQDKELQQKIETQVHVYVHEFVQRKCEDARKRYETLSKKLQMVTPKLGKVYLKYRMSLQTERYITFERYISTKATVVIVAALAATAVLAGPIGVGLIVAGAGFAAAGHAGTFFFGQRAKLNDKQIMDARKKCEDIISGPRTAADVVKLCKSAYKSYSDSVTKEILNHASLCKSKYLAECQGNLDMATNVSEEIGEQMNSLEGALELFSDLQGKLINMKSQVNDDEDYVLRQWPYVTDTD